MDFIDVFQEILLKNNGSVFGNYSMYLVNAIKYADDNFFDKDVSLVDQEITKQRSDQKWLDLFEQFLKDNNVSQECINASKEAILDSVDYLRVIEVS